MKEHKKMRKERFPERKESKVRRRGSTKRGKQLNQKENGMGVIHQREALPKVKFILPGDPLSATLSLFHLCPANEIKQCT